LFRFLISQFRIDLKILQSY